MATLSDLTAQQILQYISLPEIGIFGIQRIGNDISIGNRSVPATSKALFTNFLNACGHPVAGIDAANNEALEQALAWYIAFRYGKLSDQSRRNADNCRPMGKEFYNLCLSRIAEILNGIITGLGTCVIKKLTVNPLEEARPKYRRKNFGSRLVYPGKNPQNPIDYNAK